MSAPRRRYRVPLPDGRALDLGPRTLVMGVLNVTPDSFSQPRRAVDHARSVDDGLALASAGADLIDVGGESTRPGASPVSAGEERRRVLPVVEGIARQTNVPVAVDTSKADVARAALEAGALVVNDISGLAYDPQLAAVVAAAGAAVVLMHMRGRPPDMHEHARYASVAGEIASELRAAMQRATDAGVPADSVILDPGLGFAKRARHSMEALARLDAPELLALDRPFLVGPSRKSFLDLATGAQPAPDREWATAAAVAAAVLLGAHIVRVHAVREMAQVVRVADAIRRARSGDLTAPSP